MEGKDLLLVVCFFGARQTLLDASRYSASVTAFGQVSPASLKRTYQADLYFVLSQAVVTVQRKFYSECFVSGNLLLIWKS